MAKQLMLSIILLSVALLCYGETKPLLKAESYPVSVKASAGFSNYGMWLLGMGVEYTPIRYIGVSANFHISDVPGSGTTISGYTKSGLFYRSTDHLNTTIYFMPELDIHAPLIRIGNKSKNRRTDSGILMTVSPGISIPALYPKRVRADYISMTGFSHQDKSDRFISEVTDTKDFKLRGNISTCFFLGLSVDYVLDFIRIGLNMTFSENDPFSMARGTEMEGKTISVPQKEKLYITGAIRFTYCFSFKKRK